MLMRLFPASVTYNRRFRSTAMLRGPLKRFVVVPEAEEKKLGCPKTLVAGIPFVSCCGAPAKSSTRLCADFLGSPNDFEKPPGS